MRNQTLNISCLTLLLLLQVCILPNVYAQAETCIAPNGSAGYCLVYTECANLTQWREHHNLKTSEDVQKMFCKQDQIHVCCNYTNPYFTGVDYLSQLNPEGLALLQSVQCTRPISDRVANGENAILGEYPFMALLRYDGAKRPYLCGGSLITNRFVLTAAHCITRKLVGVRLGEHDLRTDIDCASDTLCLPEAEDFEIAQIIKHPSYNQPYMTHDVALLKLDRKVKFKVHIKPICLPITPLVLDYNNLPKSYYIAPYAPENTTSTDILQRAEIPHQDREVCKRIFGPMGVGITNDHICAGGERQVDTCKGDSGGPLFASVPFKKVKKITFNRQVQYGIVSFGLIGCGGEGTSAAAYANVFEYMPWITEMLAEHT
ncbi:serine protease grass-like [Rhagoletis pomonella]|uniref:serine protease grass-like n=1 Tax=Rhagoletis pomonella TaxID=28610 RepID=UPI00177C6D44|nr:serine protease grass-like [Rhagoletis pomonella]